MKDILMEENNAIKQNFEVAVKLVKSLPQKGSFQPSYSEAAQIYSFYKQSKFGKCNIPKPGFWDYLNRAKWEAWAALGEMSQEDAMKKYVIEIKNIYLRIKDIDEFQEKEYEYAEILIPFCQRNDIEMSPKLKLILNENFSDKNGFEVPVNNSSSNEDVKINSNKNSNGLTGDDETVKEQAKNLKCEENDSEHSVLMEKSLPQKTVSFDFNKEKKNGYLKTSNVKENEIVNNNDDDDDDDDDEEEEDIYCDPIGPEDILENGDSSVFEITNISESGSSQISNNDSSTPYKLEVNKQVSTSSNSDSFEVLPNDSGYSYKNNVATTSAEQSKVSKLLKRPHKRHKKQFNNFKSHNGNPRQNKRLDQQQQGNSQNTQSQNTRGNHSSHSQNTQSNHNQPNQTTLFSTREDRDGNDDEFSSSSSSYTDSDDTIGLKIVTSLERMEDNLVHVIDRLDSIDKSLTAIARPTTPWWNKYLPSKSILLWTAWPVLVNVLFLLYWKRISRQKLKKC